MRTAQIGVLTKNQQDIYAYQKNMVKKQEITKDDTIENVSNPNRIGYQPTEKGLAALQAAELEEAMSNTEEGGTKKDQLKAMKIARNIMRGKIVPKQDEQYLMEFDAKLYEVAKAIAALEEQTEKVKSELDEDTTFQQQLKEIMNQAELEGMGEEITNECDIQE